MGSHSSKRMKILEVVPRFKLAGAERMAESLIYGLTCLNQDVEVVSLFDHPSSITEGFCAKGITLHSLGKKQGLDLSLLVKLTSLFRSRKPDVVHTHLYAAKYAIPAAKLAGVPVCLHTVHSIAEEELSSADRKLQRFFYKTGMAIPVSISPMVRKTVSECYGLSEDNLPLVYNGVTRPKVGSHTEEKDVFNYLHIGRFEPVKNHGVLIDAFERTLRVVPDARLTLLGAGELYSEISSKIDSLGIASNVRMVGEVSDVCPFLEEADVLVLPSVYEGFPITLIEALQAGVPCVCSNVGGIPDIVIDGYNGVLCEPNVENLTEAMVLVATDSSYVAGLRSNCRSSCEDYTQEKMSENYLALMKRLVLDED